MAKAKAPAKKTAAPKRRQDKRAIKLLEKALRALNKVSVQIRKTSPGTGDKLRASYARENVSVVLEHLKAEKSGWIDLPSKKDRKAAKKKGSKKTK